MKRLIFRIVPPVLILAAVFAAGVGYGTEHRIDLNFAKQPKTELPVHYMPSRENDPMFVVRSM
jgi:hypothetical protein